MCSVPMDNRMVVDGCRRPQLCFVQLRVGGGSGWMTSDFTSAALASSGENSFSDSVNRLACSSVPFSSKVKMEPV